MEFCSAYRREAEVAGESAHDLHLAISDSDSRIFLHTGGNQITVLVQGKGFVHHAVLFDLRLGFLPRGAGLTICGQGLAVGLCEHVHPEEDRDDRLPFLLCRLREPLRHFRNAGFRLWLIPV